MNKNKTSAIACRGHFIYTLANVSIKLTDGTTQEKTIIGRTNNSLITIDDELIDVSKISQIDFLD